VRSDLSDSDDESAYRISSLKDQAAFQARGGGDKRGGSSGGGDGGGDGGGGGGKGEARGGAAFERLVSGGLADGLEGKQAGWHPAVVQAITAEGHFQVRVLISSSADVEMLAQSLFLFEILLALVLF